MADEASMLWANIHFLKQGMKLIREIDDDLYVNTKKSCFSSGVGKHVRHVLDHYLSLLRDNNGRIDYDDRERDRRIEEDRQYAVSLFREIVEKLGEFNGEIQWFEKTVRVKSNEGTETLDAPWSSSTVNRELQFLLSHTIHHYAMVALILRIQGYQPPENFGMAPSTIQYQKEQSSDLFR